MALGRRTWWIDFFSAVVEHSEGGKAFKRLSSYRSPDKIETLVRNRVMAEFVLEAARKGKIATPATRGSLLHRTRRLTEKGRQLGEELRSVDSGAFSTADRLFLSRFPERLEEIANLLDPNWYLANLVKRPAGLEELEKIVEDQEVLLLEDFRGAVRPGDIPRETISELLGACHDVIEEATGRRPPLEVDPDAMKRRHRRFKKSGRLPISLDDVPQLHHLAWRRGVSPLPEKSS